MAYWQKITYTRDSTDRIWYARQDELGNQIVGQKLQQFQSEGKVIHYEVKQSVGGYEQYIKIGFDSLASFNEFYGSGEYLASVTNRDDYLNNRGLTYASVESTEEPTI